jgi:hypothetical protein
MPSIGGYEGIILTGLCCVALLTVGGMGIFFVMRRNKVSQ